jgi:hypothetical protein
MTARDVESTADCTRVLDDKILMTPVSSSEEDDYKSRRSAYPPPRRNNRPTHRSHSRSNAKSRSSTKGDVNHDYLVQDSHGGLESLLVKLIEALENDSRTDDPDITNSSVIDDVSSFDDVDRCQKWLDNWEKIEKAFPGKNDTSQSS